MRARSRRSPGIAVVALVVSACGGGGARTRDAAPGDDAGLDTSSAVDVAAGGTGGAAAGAAGTGGAGAGGVSGSPGGAGGRGGGQAGSSGAGAGGRDAAAEAGPGDASDAATSTDGAGRDAVSDRIASDGAADAGRACAVCTTWGSPALAGRVTASTLNNLSGMAVSSRNPGVLYVHNDMTRQQFFAVSETGALLGTYSWTGTTVEDIEDMAVAHCPTGSCVYLADIGGNLAARTTFAIVRAPEPTVTVDRRRSRGASRSSAWPSVTRTACTTRNRCWSIPGRTTCTSSPSPTPGPRPSIAWRVASARRPWSRARSPMLTVPKSSDRQTSAASAHPCGTGFLLRTYNTLYEFRVASGAPFESAFAAAPVTVPVATESQGEAVAYGPDGLRYFTTGEGAMPALNRVDCAVAATAARR